MTDRLNFDTTARMFQIVEDEKWEAQQPVGDPILVVRPTPVAKVYTDANGQPIDFMALLGLDR